MNTGLHKTRLCSKIVYIHNGMKRCVTYLITSTNERKETCPHSYTLAVWLPRTGGDFSCVAVSQLYSFSAPPTSSIFMVSDRQQPHFHLAAALPAKAAIPLDVSLRQKNL